MSKVYGIKLGVDGTVETLTSPVNYETLRDAVGGLIQPVECPAGDWLYVNEEGLLLGLWQNLGAQMVAMHPGPLVGDAILVGPLDEEGDHTLPISAAAQKFILG